MCIRTTLIVPKMKKNYRLTYYPYPHFIDSAVNDDTKMQDYFEIQETITNLSNDGISLCNVNSFDAFFELCSKTDFGLKEWKIIDTYREAKFKDEENNCLTMLYNKIKNTHDLILSPCDENSENQIFIITADHGDKTKPNINVLNIDIITE